MTLITDLGETMRAIILSMVIAVFVGSAIAAELLDGGKLTPYEKWQKTATAGGDGDYFVLVSAEWCQPCSRLKAQLRGARYAGVELGVLDVDRFPVTKDKLMKQLGFKTIPTVIRYRKKDGKWQEPVLWDGAGLDEFLGIEVKNELSSVEKNLWRSVTFAGMLNAVGFRLLTRGEGYLGLGAAGAN